MVTWILANSTRVSNTASLQQIPHYTHKLHNGPESIYRGRSIAWEKRKLNFLFPRLYGQKSVIFSFSTTQLYISCTMLKFFILPYIRFFRASFSVSFFSLRWWYPSVYILSLQQYSLWEDSQRIKHLQRNLWSCVERWWRIRRKNTQETRRSNGVMRKMRKFVVFIYFFQLVTLRPLGDEGCELVKEKNIYLKRRWNFV